MSSSTMTVRLPEKTKTRLDELAKHTRRTRPFLAGEAIAACVNRELAIVTGVERGLADMKAGRITRHEDVMAEIDEILDTAERHGLALEAGGLGE